MLTVQYATAQTQIGADIDGEAARDLSGTSTTLSANGNVMAVGAENNVGKYGVSSGHVRVFVRNGNAWVQQGADIEGDSTFEAFGVSCELNHDGSILVVGADNSDLFIYSAGRVSVYKWDGNSWNQMGQDLFGKSGISYFGASVGINASGTRVVAGGPISNTSSGQNSGYVRAYEWNGTSWIQMGQDINGQSGTDRCGTSVAMSADGNRIIIGSPENDAMGINAGLARVYAWNGTTWYQMGQDLVGNAASAYFGKACDISGDGLSIAIGAPRDTINNYKGYVNTYTWSGTTWVLKGASILGVDPGGAFGNALNFNYDGSLLAIAAFETNIRTGTSRIFEYYGNSWLKIGQNIVGEALRDEAGYSIAVDSIGNTVSIGARLNQGNGFNAGHVRVYDISQIVTVSELASLKEKIEVFPNPFQERFTIQLNESLNGKIVVRNSLGQAIEEKNISQQKLVQIELGNAKEGLYFVEIQRLNGTKSLHKVVKLAVH